MAITGLAATTTFSQTHKLPRAAYIDAVKWLPPLSPLSTLFAVALLESPLSPPLAIPGSTSQRLSLDPSTCSLQAPRGTSSCTRWTIRGFQPILGIDVADSVGVVSVGEDGVNLVNFGRVGKSFRRVFDGEGLVGFNAVKWASPSEFVTGGCGLGLQWWDLRRPGCPGSQFKGN